MGCIFCQIVNGQAAAEKVYEDEDILAFLDAHPVTPTHILIIPKKHFDSLNEMNAEDGGIFGKMVFIAKELAKKYKINSSGFRLVVNTGPDAGQSVFHMHLHLLGGRKMPFHFREFPV